MAIFGGGPAQQQSGGMSPINMALMGLLAYRTFQGKGRLADMLGRNASVPATPSATVPQTTPQSSSDGLGGLLSGGLGGLLGAQGAGSAISDGLRHLMEMFQQNGHGDKVQSWVQDGPNQTVSQPELERVLGPERLKWLMDQTGLPKDELLTGLSHKLPETVDRLTPDGRLPQPDEATWQFWH